MPEVDAKSARYEDNAMPNRIARAAAERLYERVQESGYTERSFCTDVGMARRTWRGVTGRPYPSDGRGTRSLLSLRDFIAICERMHLNPALVLTELMKADADARSPIT